MATVHFDEDLRRIYEVPENSSFTVDGGGYRIYTPDNIGTAESSVNMTIEYIVNRFNDFHNLNKWSTLPFIKTGGAFRFNDEDGNPVYATADYRLQNNWEIVLANYPHELNILGNVFGDAVTGRIFDSTRLTSQGVSRSVQRADSLQVINAGLTQEEKDRLSNVEVLLQTIEPIINAIKTVTDWLFKWNNADEVKQADGTVTKYEEGTNTVLGNPKIMTQDCDAGTGSLIKK